MSQEALPDEVVTVLACDIRIDRLELTGSRARGTATALSDWDFTVATADFEAVRDALPTLTAPLRPVVAQWDRLSRKWCYMMILAGPVRVDLIFDKPHPIEPPWVVNAATLAAIDDHFWDWTLWLVSKHLAGRNGVVTAELGKLHAHLLAPLGVATVPDSFDEAVAVYKAARHGWEKRLRRPVSRNAETAVLPSLRQLSARPQ